MSGVSNLLLRHEERVFGPVTLGQVRELLTSGAVTPADSVREENGPWILIRDYLEWKDAANAPVADISELLGKAASKPPAGKPAEPKSSAEARASEKPAEPAPQLPRNHAKEALKERPAEPRSGESKSAPSKPAAPKSDYDPDYIPLADIGPDPGLGETREMESPYKPQREPGAGRGAGTGGGSTGRRDRGSKPSAEPTKPGKGSSADAIPVAAVPEARPTSRSTPPRADRSSSRRPAANPGANPGGANRSVPDRSAADRRSQNTLENIALPEDADLDAILRAMAAYELTAPPLRPGGRH